MAAWLQLGDYFSLSCGYLFAELGRTHTPRRSTVDAAKYTHTHTHTHTHTQTVANYHTTRQKGWVVVGGGGWGHGKLELCMR